ncbi:MAG TPA: c-type cytochrome [Caulobacteraceae bacterium]|jgi:cytochrome c1|nr:c-type cytochrome [Caulobacteraceae bacterium]
MRRAFLLDCLAPGCLVLAGCGVQVSAPHWRTGGDARQGAVIVVRESCGACHQIPNIPQADGQVGPPLDHFAERTVIAGMLPNTPANLERWIRSPQTVTPGNAMPDSKMSEAEARDVAAYLYTLR